MWAEWLLLSVFAPMSLAGQTASPRVCGVTGKRGQGRGMRFSYKIFRVFGIDVRVHLSFLFIVAYFAYRLGRACWSRAGSGAALYGVLLVMLLFALVVIHELTHARVAQQYGIAVKRHHAAAHRRHGDHGGDPEEPRKELAISIAGPLSNLVIAASHVRGASVRGRLEHLSL